MKQIIHAVYEAGQLRLLESVELAEGQHVRVMIEPIDEKDRLRAALSDLVVHWPDPTDDRDAEVEQYADEIDRAFQGDPPLSEIIIKGRGC
jgi:predicted DNA-binding antitoxin AbrB/MazE fold protein